MPWHGVIAVISLFLNISSDLLPLTGGSFALLADICTQLILPATKVFVWNQLENKTSSFHLSFDVVTPVQPAIERSTVLNTSLFKVSPILFQSVCFCYCVKSFKYLQQLHPTVRLEHLVRTRHLCFWSTATLCFSPIYVLLWLSKIFASIRSPGSIGLRSSQGPAPPFRQPSHWKYQWKRLKTNFDITRFLNSIGNIVDSLEYLVFSHSPLNRREQDHLPSWDRPRAPKQHIFHSHLCCTAQPGF